VQQGHPAQADGQLSAGAGGGDAPQTPGNRRACLDRDDAGADHLVGLGPELHDVG
jgi:hypothetical protein